MNKETVLKPQEIEHWLGHRFMNGDSSDCQEWLPDLIGRLANKELTVKEIVKEIENAIKELVDKTNENTKNIAINIQKIESNIKIHEDAITKLELNNKKIMM